ncbi:MAG: protoporphyrinogen oxidase [Anaerolineae bacterium]|nr:protoporphyrinogen oxidase [Anaerolineae bacterium]MDW8070466.1 protoporphyrinogen oxidase [Anaerolineae bacterium]
MNSTRFSEPLHRLDTDTFHVVIIGGGITGLAAAYYLEKHAPPYVTYSVLEGDTRWGGKIVTENISGFIVEGGPDSFLTQKPAALNLCRELGLEERLLGTNEAQRKVYVLLNGRLRPLPDGVMLVIPTRFTPFVTSSLISWPGKLRMALDLVIPRRRQDGDESLASFIRRRLGQEALDKIAEPLMAGIHVADAERQSLAATFPRFMELERVHRSLIKGMLIQKRQLARRAVPAPPLFMTLRDGLGELVSALCARLRGDMRLNSPVVRLEKVDGNGMATPHGRANGYLVRLRDGQTIYADAIVLAVPAYTAATLVAPLHATLAQRLHSIRYVSTATLSLGYRRSELDHPLDGFGFVVPRREPTHLMACTWTSTKFFHRAPAGYALLRVFLGGPHREATLALDDEAILDLVRKELQCIMGIRADPVFVRLHRWQDANPQYDVGHLERVAEIEGLVAALPGLYLTGSAFRGVGIPDCIVQGENVAKAVLSMAVQRAAH